MEPAKFFACRVEQVAHLYEGVICMCPRIGGRIKSDLCGDNVKDVIRSRTQSCISKEASNASK